MSVVADIRENDPPIDTESDGDGWAGNLCLAWAQITEGSASCDYCGEPARVLIATGADPDYAPTCWQHGAVMISSAFDCSTMLWGEKEQP